MNECLSITDRCLGDADGIAQSSSASGRVEGYAYTWDYGTIYNPHVVKLVDKVWHTSILHVVIHALTNELSIYPLGIYLSDIV